MPKRVKITLYVILILIIIAVVRLMIWTSKPVIETTEDISNHIEENTEQNTEEKQLETVSFEEDVMKDLEWFFGNNNWYEDVEWEFWFTELENE